MATPTGPRLLRRRMNGGTILRRAGVNCIRCSWCSKIVRHRRWTGWLHICRGSMTSHGAVSRRV